MVSRVREMAMPRGAIVPLLCVVHCLATPLLVVVAPVLAVSESLEWAGLVLAAAVGVYAGVAGVRVHGRWLVWLPMLAGLGLWTMGLLGWVPGAPEWATTAVGAGALAAALIWEGRLRHRVECPACGSGAAH